MPEPTDAPARPVPTDLNLGLLRELSEAPGVPGREEAVRAIVEREARPLFDDLSTDAMGTLYATKRAEGKPKALFACHVDEIGFYVRHVDDKGLLRVQNVGGFDTRNLFARRVRVQTGGLSGGEALVGVLNPAGRPLHIAKEEDKKKVPEIGEFFVDLCLPAETVKAKVRIGDPVTLVQSFEEIGDCVNGKCLDNRVAAWVVIEAMKQIASGGGEIKYEFTLAATVQEEVGLRGAAPAAYAVQPDVAVALDTTLCVDTPGVPDDERVTRQGEGVAVKIMDSASISDRRLVEQFVAVAERHDIPHQLSVLPRGGTDAGAMQRVRRGARTATLAVPTRYIHTVTETVHKRDLKSAIDLVAAWLTTEPG